MKNMLEDLVAERTHDLACSNCRLEDEIMEHRATEKALLWSEKRYRTIFESILDTYFRIGAYGSVAEISPSGARLLNYESPDELIGKNFARDLCAETLHNRQDCPGAAK